MPSRGFLIKSQVTLAFHAHANGQLLRYVTIVVDWMATKTLELKSPRLL